MTAQSVKILKKKGCKFLLLKSQHRDLLIHVQVYLSPVPLRLFCGSQPLQHSHTLFLSPHEHFNYSVLDKLLCVRVFQHFYSALVARRLSFSNIHNDELLRSVGQQAEQCIYIKRNGDDAMLTGSTAASA